MAVPTSQSDRTAVSRSGSRNDSRSPGPRVIMRAIPDQIRIIGRDRGRVARWLNIACVYWLVSRDFLLEIADRDIERAAGEQIRGGIVVARLSKLPVRVSAGEMHKCQGSNKYNKGKNDNERSAFGCAMRIEELFHGVKTFVGLEGLGDIKIPSVQLNTENFRA